MLLHQCLAIPKWVKKLVGLVLASDSDVEGEPTPSSTGRVTQVSLRGPQLPILMVTHPPVAILQRRLLLAACIPDLVHGYKHSRSRRGRSSPWGFPLVDLHSIINKRPSSPPGHQDLSTHPKRPVGRRSSSRRSRRVHLLGLMKGLLLLWKRKQCGGGRR